MDLFAYSQINDLESIAKANGIDVPRLRGYRLMRTETPLNLWKENKEITAVDCVRDLCSSRPFWSPNNYAYCSNSHTRYLEKFYLKKEGDNVEVRWDRIHGWKRKVLKTYIHNEIKKQEKQFDTWNKYVGREDILYIHARIGGGNWPNYYKEVVNQPWFIEKVDDAYDSTYCDIYAKIKP
jgi:hypothetical protein